MRGALPGLAVVLAGCVHAPIPDHRSDEIAIRTTVARLVESWNAKDSANFSSVFAARHDYIAVDGQLRLDVTPAGNAAAHQQVWRFLYPEGSTIRMDVRAIRFPAPDVAVQITNRNDFLREGRTQALTSSLTGVLVREDGAWKFAAFNNNPGQSGPGAPASPQ